MKNILKIITFCFIIFSGTSYANSNYIVEEIKVDNEILNCYYNYNNPLDKENEFGVIKESNMYYFYLNKELFFTLSREPLNYYDYENKRYYIGSLQNKAFDFSERYSICFKERSL